MYRSDVRSRLEGLLERSPAAVAAPGDRLAAVLLPVVEGDRVVFTRRTEHLSRHPGEISFPGGLEHEEDADLVATALRETEEELGLPRDRVEVLGALEPVHTFVSAILIVPFVGVVSGEPAFAPSEHEIAEVLSYPLGELSAAETTVEWPRDGHVYRGFAYPMSDGNTIWGATAKILNEMIELLRRQALSEQTYVPSDPELRSILGDARTIAVVGLSSNAERPSFEVAEYLQSKGYRIVPVNPNETEVLGERAYPTLADVPSDIDIDVVDVFRRAEQTPEVAEQAVARGATVLWLQEGIANDEARRIGETGGLSVVMGVCMRKQSLRLEASEGES